MPNTKYSSLSEEELCINFMQSSKDKHLECKAIIDLARIMKKSNPSKLSSSSTIEEKFFDKVAFGMSECWYWYGAKHYLGYGLMSALGETKAHRVSWIIHNGKIPDGLSVLHKCDVRNCVNPNHLFLGTQKDNVLDMHNKNRNVNSPRYGEKNPISKFTNLQAIQIREEFLNCNVLQIELARKYNVSPMAISRLIRKETYNENV